MDHSARPQLSAPPAYGNAATPKEDTAIRNRLCSIEQWLSDLHSTAQMLEERLDTVLTPVPPSPAERAVNGVPAGRPQSHMQGRLEILADGFAALNGRLHQLAQRIEL